MPDRGRAWKGRAVPVTWHNLSVHLDVRAKDAEAERARTRRVRSAHGRARLGCGRQQGLRAFSVVRFMDCVRW